MLHQLLHRFLEENILCAGSEVFTIEVLRSLVQGLPYRCSGNFWMFCHQKQPSRLKRSPHPSALMGCTSLQVKQEGKQSISNAAPPQHLFTFFPTTFQNQHTYMKRGGGGGGKPVFCTLSFTVFNQLIQALPQKVIPHTLKEKRQLCAARRQSKHSLKIEARSTLQIFDSTAMSVTNLMEHNL